jgi:dephospho-CoA kinase
VTESAFAIIGLTGGIASGKSTVSRMCRELGVPVVDADEIARFVVEPGQPAATQIREQFGDEVFAADGTLNREALGAVVFADPGARARLNAITHPRIALEMKTRADALREAGHPWIIYDAALLVENRAQEWLGGLIVVSLPRELQLQRLMARDDGDQDRAAARIDSQLPLADKVAVADWVIDNGQGLEHTRAQVREVCEAIGRSVAEHGHAKRERAQA